MPELPEVETVCRGLALHIPGQRITEVKVNRRQLRIALPDNFENLLIGRTVTAVTRRAKYILIHLDNADIWLVHLGMSGNMVLHEAIPNEYRKHDHIIVSLTPHFTLVFNDARRFGLMTLIPKAELESHVLLANLGKEPFDAEMTAVYFHATLQKSQSPIKLAIMDQRKIVGVGNIYACEALFRSSIAPERKASSLTQAESGLLLTTIQTVLNEAIASGGSTLRDYVRSSGDAGYFQHHFQVYGKAGEPCPVCDTPISIIRQSGRSTFFCRVCQK